MLFHTGDQIFCNQGPFELQNKFHGPPQDRQEHYFNLSSNILCIN